MNRNETEIAVRGEYITLGQLLKLIGLAGTGGAARILLSEGETLVNGEVEERRGRKLRPGDSVALPDGATVRLV
jgi:ribosome-associated protein YbcJ (S4-like RNA binding protein)